ncbi:hypothetical protein [Psychrobacter aquaticus]|uniref:Glycosyl transferase family 28 C-terminal domain-containing protein n=1 Tax=Psychrobacter aquaticus CMS 56 TaxID=1354303 RepID=U4T353_9GAMM|nr:hypothetical protein [Psychrobacter aquaticus]ERL55115.1 hypothetical protein M917_2461 [Psychrobacter aquaticus CMS 56]
MRIGYYAHHHGSGHCRQIDKLAGLLPLENRQQLTVFTSLTSEGYTFTAINEQQIIRLHAEDERADDVLKGRAGEHWQPASLHYSPVGNADIQKRSHQILDTIYQRKIDLMIVDVSVEVAMLCRTASVPYLYVRLPGCRDDVPHLEAFAGALALVAPYPRVLEAAMTPRWVTQKTLYLDFITPTKNNPSTYEDFVKTLMALTDDDKVREAFSASAQIITVIKGYGGHEAIDAKLPELRRLLPNTLIISLGPIDDAMRRYVDIATHVDDVTPFMQHSDYLLMACGLNAVAQAYHQATPLVVLPDERPHQEQEVMAQALIAQGRALSWEQFKSLVTDKHIPANSDKLFLQQIQDDKSQMPSLTSTDYLPAAQAFMSSTTTYSTTKSWFNEWLLPQLNLKPDLGHS